MESLTEIEFKRFVFVQLTQNKVFGSTNIAKFCVKNLIKFIKDYNINYVNRLSSFKSEIKNFIEELNDFLEYEPLSRNSLKYISRELDSCQDTNELILLVSQKAREYFNYIDESYEIIKENANTYLKRHNSFITISNSTLVKQSLSSLKHKISVQILESRPKLNGRLQAISLSESNNISVTLVLDNMIGSIFTNENYSKPDCVVIGAESICVDGSLIAVNGSLNIALIAYLSEIPFYVISQSMKIDISRKSFTSFKPTLYEDSLIWRSSPDEVGIVSSTLEAIPANYITGGYITERGLLNPDEIKDLL